MGGDSMSTNDLAITLECCVANGAEDIVGSPSARHLLQMRNRQNKGVCRRAADVFDNIRVALPT
jgi:hypothetical protein